MAGFVLKFRSREKEPEIKPVDCSKKIITTYKLQYDKDHIVKVVKSGEVNIYEKIQTYANDCDFSRIIKNIQLSGNNFLYADSRTSDIDLTKMPQNIVEAKKVSDEAQKLEKVVKNSEYFKQKGLSFEEFIKSYNSLEHASWLKSKYERKEDNK